MSNETATPFDPDEFINAQQTAQVESNRTNLPADEYPAHVKPGSVKVEVVPFEKNGVAITMKDGSVVVGGKRLTLYWNIDDREALDKIGLQEHSVRQQFLLDLDRDTGNIASGVNKNIRLGKIFAANGKDISKGGWSFAEIESFTGRVRVNHRPDKNDAEKVYEEVVAVTRL